MLVFFLVIIVVVDVVGITSDDKGTTNMSHIRTVWETSSFVFKCFEYRLKNKKKLEIYSMSDSFGKLIYHKLKTTNDESLIQKHPFARLDANVYLIEKHIKTEKKTQQKHTKSINLSISS